MDGLRVEDLGKYKFPSNVKFSPNGKNICLNVHETNIEDNVYDSNLWIYSLEDDELYQLTNSGEDNDFIWLNNEEILFLSERNSDDKKDNKIETSTDLFKINIFGGEANFFDSIDKNIAEMKLMDSELLLKVKENIKNEDSNGESEKDNQLKEGKDYYEIDEIPYWQNGEGFTNKKRSHLYSYTLDDKNLTKLVGGYKDVVDFDFNEDEVCLNINKYEDKKNIENNLHLYDLKTNSLEKITEKDLKIESVRYLGDDLIFEATNKEEMGIYTNLEIYLYNKNTKKAEKITDLDQTIGNSILTDIFYGKGKTSVTEDQNYYYISTEGFKTYLNKFSLENGVDKVFKADSIKFFDIKDGNIAFIDARNNRPPELYLNRNKETQVTFFNDFKKQLSRPEHYSIKSNGKEIDAWIIKPTNFDENKDYPAILEIHGGPKANYSDVHFNEFQVLANQGYVVIYSNPTGSSGKGNEFADIRGKYGLKDYEDIMNVLKNTLKKYDFIDKNRLGVTGGSYGGFMTNWIISHTDKFKAAVSARSISNWISMFGTTDIGYYFVEDQFKTNPWKDFEKLWERSPMKYANKANTPTLFIHSRQDYRCWESEVLQMHTSLKYNGIDSKVILFEDQNHDLSRTGNPKQRIKRLEEMVKWFNKHLK